MHSNAPGIFISEPDKPALVKILKALSTSITVQYSALSNHNGPIVWYTLYLHYRQNTRKLLKTVRTNNTNIASYTVTVTKLDPYTDYFISYSATNGAGEGERSNAVVGKTSMIGKNKNNLICST